ncbi:MAG: hypothetical protein LAO31_06675 [Acidobacteriia bacterium]|nr:hypothetical protein [Terriglobia bacterium]
MIKAMNFPKSDDDVRRLRSKAGDVLRAKLPAAGGEKLLEIKTTDKDRERRNPIDPPFLLVDTGSTALLDCIVEMAQEYGRLETVSTVEVFCRHKDSVGEYYNEHVVSFHRPDGAPGDSRRESITITVLGNIGVYNPHSTSRQRVLEEAEVLV